MRIEIESFQMAHRELERAVDAFYVEVRSIIAGQPRNVTRVVMLQEQMRLAQRAFVQAAKAFTEDKIR